MDFVNYSRQINDYMMDVVFATTDVFYADISGEDLWNTYLGSFPEGTNPLYKTNTYHDCECCKQFIRNMGGVFAIGEVFGNITAREYNHDATLYRVYTIWDKFEEAPYPYNVVGERMNSFVVNAILDKGIRSIFVTSEGCYGNKRTLKALEDGTVIGYDHFWVDVPSRYVSTSPQSLIDTNKTMVQCVERVLKEISLDAIETVMGLIDDGILYRGDEYKVALCKLRTLKKKHNTSSTLLAGDTVAAAVFYWAKHLDYRVATIRNSAIGTLLVNLSEGMELENAVRRYESVVAPHNYKRPKALITKRMVEDAVRTLRGIGYEDSLARRLAKLDDISVNDVIWASGSAQTVMEKSALDNIVSDVPSSYKVKRGGCRDGVNVGIEEFVTSILPNAKDIKLYLDNNMSNNLIALTAPQNKSAKSMFVWDNPFGWSYKCDVADSIARRVRKAGGSTEGKLRVSLAWYNSDDLDLHCRAPSNNHIYFGNKCGVLDVDMNIFGENPKDPVENMIFKSLYDGVYSFNVHNHTKRNNTNGGFVLEVTYNEGDKQVVRHYYYHDIVRHNNTIGYINVHVKGGSVIGVENTHGGITSQDTSRREWGLNTMSYVPVSSVMYSPNFWGNSKVGNKHYVFVLEGCKPDEPVRGIYNEFLHSDLHKHRKVLEVVGSKTRCFVGDDHENLLCGIGLSSSRKTDDLDKVVVQVDGTSYAVQF